MCSFHSPWRKELKSRTALAPALLVEGVSVAPEFSVPASVFSINAKWIAAGERMVARVGRAVISPFPRSNRWFPSRRLLPCTHCFLHFHRHRSPFLTGRSALAQVFRPEMEFVGRPAFAAKLRMPYAVFLRVETRIATFAVTQV